MKSIQINPQYLESLKSRKSKHKYEWQSKAEEVSAYYGVPLYWIFHKFPDYEIMEEFEYRKEKGDRDTQFFIRILKAKQKKKTMTRETLLEMMRDDYRKKDLNGLRRHFTMGQWLLKDGDKENIRIGIKRLEEDGIHPVTREALDILGGRIIT